MTSIDPLSQIPQQEIPTFKVVLLGETAVGKSCLISRYVNNTFLSNFVPTMGGYFTSKEIFYKDINKKIKLDIWDTAGQEKYRSITKMFYKDASVAILVYDITRQESFLEIKNFWYQEVKENSPENLVIAIVGNKKDLYEYEEVNKEDCENFANEVGAVFKETSAKTGGGVDEMFQLIGMKLIAPENYDKIVNGENWKKKAKKSIILNNTNNDNGAKDSQFMKGSMVEEKKKCCS